MSKVRLRCLKSSAEPSIRKLAAYRVQGVKVQLLKDYDPAGEAKKVWEWSARNVGSEWKTLDIDLTPFCKDACPYQVDFHGAAGSKPLEIQSLNLVFDGTVIPGFVQRAPQSDAERFYVTITALGKSLGLRAVVRVASGQKESKGIVTIGKRRM